MSPPAAALAALAFALPALAAEQPAATVPDSHMAYTAALVELLSQTEICLNSCRDAASVSAALPQLRELSGQAARLASALPLLPEPTTQDYMAAHPQVRPFNLLWKAIGDHIERLTAEGLMTPELREVLGIAPPEASAPTP